nr:MAG TPA: hypothetical protein [Caudoviricetes sp.]
MALTRDNVTPRGVKRAQKPAKKPGSPFTTSPARQP